MTNTIIEIKKIKPKMYAFYTIYFINYKYKFHVIKSMNMD
jgi:hypothetical protein